MALLFASAISAATPYQHLPSADEVSRDVASVGAREVLVKRIFANDQVTEEFASRIETGDPKWLAVAVLLRPASDAGSSESLVGALSVALAAQPRAVLRILANPASGFTAKDVCSGRLVYLEQPKQERAWNSRARRAVAAVKDPSLKTVSSECLRLLRQ